MIPAKSVERLPIESQAAGTGTLLMVPALWTHCKIHPTIDMNALVTIIPLYLFMETRWDTNEVLDVEIWLRWQATWQNLLRPQLPGH